VAHDGYDAATSRPTNGELLTGRGGRRLCSLVTAVSAYLEASATERRRGVAVSCQWVHYCPSLTHPPSQPSPAAITNPDYTVFYLAPGGGEGMALGDLPTPTPSTV